MQSLAATDVLFALPMIAIVHWYRLTRTDWTAAAAVAGGIRVFLTLSPPGSGISAPGVVAWAPVMLAATAIAAAAILAAARARGPAQVIILAAAAGVTYGVLDALTKSWVDLLSAHGVPALLRWEPYALLAAGILGAYLTQSSFQAGALSVSLPVIDTVEPVSAVLIGATVFSERLATSPRNCPLSWPAGPWPPAASPPSADPQSQPRTVGAAAQHAARSAALGPSANSAFMPGRQGHMSSGLGPWPLLGSRQRRKAFPEEMVRHGQRHT